MSLVEAALKQDTPAYWRSLGRFVQQFADAEYFTHLLLWELVGMESGVAAAVFREQMWLSEAIDSLRKMYAVRVPHADAVAQTNRVLKQLQDISSLRNLLLHNGTEFSHSGAHTTRRLARLRDANARAPRYPMSEETLKAMTADCERIANFLASQTLAYSQANTPSEAVEMAIGMALGRHLNWEYEKPAGQPRKHS
jgi:hypothetical protein